MQTHDNPRRGREYLRVSVDRSGRERSQGEQHTENASAATGHGITLGKAYRETGSASRYATKVRGAFAALLSDLERDRFGAQVLVLWESSRGSRKVSEWVTLIELCEARGVLIFVTTHARFYDPAKPRDRRSLLEDAVDSEYESGKTSERARRAQAGSAAAGMPNGRTPFGYRRLYHPVTRKLVAQEPEPAEAQVIRELFDRLHKGHSLRSIALDFERREIRSRTGRVFSAQHLRSLATTRAYVGEREHTPGRRDKRHRGTAAQTIYVKAVWPALVTRAKFLAVQRTLTAPERVTTRPGRAVHLLSMIARCDVCSGPLAARMEKDRVDEIAYHCLKGGHIRVPYHDLNTYGEKAILAYLSREDNVAWLDSGDGGGEQLAAVRDQLAQIRTELDELADQLGRGEVSATLAARAEPAILARLKAAEAREQELSTPSVLRGLITPGRDVARRWKAVHMSAKRQVARILLSPNVLGEMRVTRSPSRGHRGPVEERVTWRRSHSMD